MNNSQKQFSDIYDQYIDKIYRFVFVKVNSQEMAEDLTSEAFLRCWEVFKDENNEIENLNAFLYSIARNLVTDHYREKGRTQVVSADYVPVADPSNDLEEKTLINSDLETVKAAMINLKEDYQNVLVLHYLNDLSVPEIAKTLKKSESAVRVMLHRALKVLKNELGEG